MKTLFPAASACLVVALVASVSYAETQIEATAEKAESTAATESKGSELSVAPLQHVTYPDDRPSWIQSEPDLRSPVHTWVVTTSGWDTMDRCETELEFLKRAAVSLYVKETTGWVCDEDLLDDDWIENDLVARRYVGMFEQGDRKLNEIAVELNFDSASRKLIQRARDNTIVDERLRMTVGLFALGLIGLFGTGGLLGVFSRRYT